jgi:hypothetical protein
MHAAHLGEKKVSSCLFLLFSATDYNVLPFIKEEKHHQQNACPSVNIFLPLMPFEINCVGGSKA